MKKTRHSWQLTLMPAFFLLSHLAQAQELPDNLNLLGGGPPASDPAASKRSAVPSPAKTDGTTGQSVSRMSKVGEEPALRIEVKYIQHQKLIETQKAQSDTSPPPSLEIPKGPSQNAGAPPLRKGEITLSQAIFEGYISFLSQKRQFGAIEFALPVRQLRSNYGDRSSGSEFGGMDLTLVAGERGVGSFGIGGQHIQSSTLNLVEKHQRLKGFFYLERGGLGTSQKGSRFHVQIGPELSMPIKGTAENTDALEYAPMYGGKALVGMLANLGMQNFIRLKTFGNYYRVNKVTQNKKTFDGGGLLSAGASLDYNVSSDLWLGVEGQWAGAKPVGREYIFGNPELPGLYGNSLAVYIQAAAF